MQLRKELVLIYTAAFLRSFGVGLLGVVLGVYLFLIGFDATHIGFVIAAGLAGGILATLFVSARGDQFGRRRILCLLSALACVGGIGLAVMPSFTGLLLFALIGMLKDRKLTGTCGCVDAEWVERRNMLNKRMRRSIVAGAIAALISWAYTAQAQMTSAEGNSEAWKAVESAMGRPGKLQPDGSFKFSMPRKDLKVTVDGTPIQAGLAFGSWLAFLGMPDHGMVMGDLVLLESEIGPVMLKLQHEGIEQTAIHNHLLRENPRVLYMHVEGHGNSVKLATALHDALALTKTPAADNAAKPAEQKIGIDVSQINSILGHTGKVNGGILQVSVPRSETITDGGMQIPSSMGTATALNFQPTGNGRAAITGDFVLLANEVNPVIRALRDNGIEVTALHSHMLNEQPRLFFMHFWANNDALKLARGLRAALDQTKSAAEPAAK